MAEILAPRQPVLDDRAMVFGAGAFAMQATPVAARFVLRMAAPPTHAAGFDLAMALNRFTLSGACLAMRPGPDEYWLIGPDVSGLADQIAADLGPAWHSLVDIGHRNFGLQLSGRAVCDVLNAGCPLDLHPASFPVGMATRTLLGKAEIVLARLQAETFRLECGRSFAPYVGDFLGEGAREWQAVA